jgi:hypothetical protein
MWSATQQQPADAFFQHWVHQAKQQQTEADHWWHGSAPDGRTAWMQQQQQQQQQGAAQEPMQSAAAAAGGMLTSVSSWISRKTQWATSSSSSSQQAPDINAAGSSTSAAAGCPLCAQEQQAQAAAAASAGGDSSSSATAIPSEAPAAACYIPGSPQQAWRDPFMWRRLLWGLLGRLKPTAQAWYVQHYAMCPHCADVLLWDSVARSIRRHLWLPPDADAVKWQLSGPFCLPIYKEQQSRMVVQYARALNEAFQVCVGGGGATELAGCSRLSLRSVARLHMTIDFCHV